MQTQCRTNITKDNQCINLRLCFSQLRETSHVTSFTFFLSGISYFLLSSLRIFHKAQLHPRMLWFRKHGCRRFLNRWTVAVKWVRVRCLISRKKTTQRVVSACQKTSRGPTAPACIKQGRFLGTVTGSLQRCAGRSAGQDNRSPGNSSM